MCQLLHDNADYSNSECESYYGDSEEAKPRHIFTDNELAEFEVIYLDTAVDLTNHYQGLSLSLYRHTAFAENYRLV